MATTKTTEVREPSSLGALPAAAAVDSAMEKVVMLPEDWDIESQFEDFRRRVSQARERGEALGEFFSEGFLADELAGLERIAEELYGKAVWEEDTLKLLLHDTQKLNYHEHATDPLVLAVGLEVANVLHAQGKVDAAVDLLKRLFDSALEELDCVGEDRYLECSPILQVQMDNLSRWCPEPRFAQRPVDDAEPYPVALAEYLSAHCQLLRAKIDFLSPTAIKSANKR